MREILFRAKIDDDNEWVYGSLVYSKSEDQYYIIEHCDEELQFPVKKETIGQFTGLVDKNGNRIFEGDVVKFDDLKSAIIWGNGEYNQISGFRLKSYPLFSISIANCVLFELIGNIHDNPELIEE